MPPPVLTHPSTTAALKACGVLCWVEAHPGLAAWIQGIGTLIALGLTLATLWATIRNAERQSREALERELRDRLAARQAHLREVHAVNEAAFAVVQRLLLAFQSIVQMLDRPGAPSVAQVREALVASFNILEREFDSFPKHTLGDFQSVILFSNIRGLLDAFKGSLGILFRESGGADDLSEAKVGSVSV